MKNALGANEHEKLYGRSQTFWGKKLITQASAGTKTMERIQKTLEEYMPEVMLSKRLQRAIYETIDATCFHRNYSLSDEDIVTISQNIFNFFKKIPIVNNSFIQNETITEITFRGIFPIVDQVWGAVYYGLAMKKKTFDYIEHRDQIREKIVNILDQLRPGPVVEMK